MRSTLGPSGRGAPSRKTAVPTANPTLVTIACESADYLVIVRHSRRKLLWLSVTAHQNAEWIARQLTEACGWNEAPRYLIRDRDGAYGETFIRRLEAMGIRDRPSSARSPWQNGHAERLIGSIRRDCLDHVVVFGERHLRHLLNSYQRYYNVVPVPILGDYTTNMFEFEFPTWTG